MSKSVWHRPSLLVRFLDLHRPSNRIVLFSFFAALTAVGGYQLTRGYDVAAALEAGLQAGFAVFLSWAVARELDPDAPESAVAASILGLLIFFTGSTQLGAVTAVLFATRILVRTTGAAPTRLDLVWLIALAVYSARLPGGVPAALALGAALLIDRQLPPPAPRRVPAGGAILLTVALAAAAYFGSLTPRWAWPTAPQWLLLAGIALAVAGLRVPAPASTDDLRGEPLSHQRLIWGTGLAVATGMASLLWIGGPAVPALVGLWAALIAISLYRRIPSGRLRIAS